MRTGVHAERAELTRGLGSRDLFEVLRRATAARFRPAGAARRFATGPARGARLRNRCPCACDRGALARSQLHGGRLLAGDAEAGIGNALTDTLGGSGPYALDAAGEARADLLERGHAVGRRSRDAVSA